jgi:hypothetical protein
LLEDLPGLTPAVAESPLRHLKFASNGDRTARPERNIFGTMTVPAAPSRTGADIDKLALAQRKRGITT